MNETVLKDIISCGIAVHKCKYIELENKTIRLYYWDESVGEGFHFYALQNSGYIYKDLEVKGEDEWNPEQCIVECLYQGYGYFDGVRHLYMGDEKTDNYGYHYYPTIEDNIMTLKAIRELEIKYCREYN